MSRFPATTLFVAVAACGGGGGSEPPPTEPGAPPSAPAPSPVQPPPAPTLKSFVDATSASNISYVVDMTPPYTTSPQIERQVEHVTFGGAAAGDCDADGDVDLFITYGDGGWNRLYLNQWDRGNPLQFEDSAVAAGVAETHPNGHNGRHSGPIFADMDGDGHLDLFIGGLFSDPSKLYRNRGDCTFEDATAESGMEDLFTDHVISAAFGDYDLDGDLDLFLTHWGSPDEFPEGGESEHLFRNVSVAERIRFENVSASSGVTGRLVDIRAYGFDKPVIDYTFTATFARINGDLWPDIAIAADFGTSQLLLNDSQAPGTFVDATNDAVHSVEFGMGSALGDIDFDGDLDWFVTSIIAEGVNSAGVLPTGNRLFRNPGGDFSAERFENVTDAAGVADGGWGWAACFLDIDNDTDLDIYHTNGWHQIYAETVFGSDESRVFVSAGNGAFVERAKGMGLDDTRNGRGVVCADFDNDGDVDILQLTNKGGSSAILWKNDSAAAGHNFLRVRLVGLPPNTEAAGARIFARIGAQTQMREIMIGSNYTSQNPVVQVFGLGTAAAVDELLVEWPGLAPGPVQPPDTRRTAVPASPAGETLVLCHPDLTAPPAACSGSD